MAKRERDRWERLEQPVGGIQGPALPSESTVHFVLDLALRIGEVQMSSGAGASDVTATILAVAGAYGMPHCEVDVIFTSITVTCHRGVDLPPVTSVRVVRSRGLDYTRLALVERLIRDITRGRVTAHDAHTELDRVTTAPHPYPRWLATLAYAGMAGAIAVLIGGDAVVALVRGGHHRARRPDRPAAQPAGAAVLLPAGRRRRAGHGLCGGGSSPSNLLPSSVTPTTMVAAAITVLLSGLSFVSTVQDAISGYNVTAAGRFVEVSMMTAGLIAGVVLALNLAVTMGLPSVPADQLDVVAAAPAAANACGRCRGGVLRAGELRDAEVARGGGRRGCRWRGRVQRARAVRRGQITASAVAATVIGFSGGVISRRLRIPPLVIAVCGMVPLLPGLTIYRALFELAVDRSNTGLSTLMVATSVALALAAGVVLGEYLAQPIRHGLGRLERRLSGPRLAGPLRPTRRRQE